MIRSAASSSARPLRAAIVGVGRGLSAQEPKAYLMGIGRHHAQAYRALGCDIVAAADLAEDDLADFGREYGVSALYTDYRELLEVERPDVVSVCAYVATRREMVEAAVEAGVSGIWSEKPLCLTLDDGRTIVETCEQAGVMLVVNHYRRFLHAFRQARETIVNGSIGEPLEIKSCLTGWDLMEQGSHWFDLFRFLLGEPRGVWVLGQMRCDGELKRYGHVMENHSVAYVAFEGGTRAVLEAGAETKPPFPPYSIRVIGTAGVLEIHDENLRVLNGSGWRSIETRSTMHEITPSGGRQLPLQPVLESLLASISGGGESEVSGRNALHAAELYLAAYESAVRSDRVDLPLDGQSVFPLHKLNRGHKAEGSLRR